MEKTLTQLLILTIFAFFVVLSAVFAKRGKITKKYLLGLLKYQGYYLMLYILIVIITPLLVIPTRQTTVIHVVLVVILTSQVQCFLGNFLIYQKRNPTPNGIPIIESLSEKITLLLKYSCGESINKVTALQN